MPLRLSIIIPTLNEAAGIAAALGALRPLRAAGHEVIVVDGGSQDGTTRIAAPLADRVLTAARGRASQMNAGAAAAQGDALLFLHADTRLPDEAVPLVLGGLFLDGLSLDGLAAGAHAWGRFDVRIEGRHPMLGLVGALMNLRSRLTGIATGDQAMFARRETFRSLGGFPALPLMEDVAFSAAAKRVSPPLCLRARVVTSGRRWESRGVLRTIVLMWWLRLRFYLGASPERLARTYEGPGAR